MPYTRLYLADVACAVWADVLHGKLDQHASVLDVDYALGRDIKSEHLPNIATTLKVRQYCEGSMTVLKCKLVLRVNTVRVVWLCWSVN